MSVDDLARQRGVTRLIHLTPTRNVPHILEAGAIRPVAELQQDVRACYVSGDLDRLDGRPDTTCCSIEYPNLHYLRHASARQPKLFPGWTAFALSLDLLARTGVLFASRNAASGTRPVVGAAGYKAMYAPQVVGSGGRLFVRDATRLPAVPTDEQAEVLVPGPISVSHIRGVIGATADSLIELRAQLEQLGRSAPSTWQWTACPDMFDSRLLTAHLRAGTRPPEVAVDHPD